MKSHEEKWIAVILLLLIVLVFYLRPLALQGRLGGVVLVLAAAVGFMLLRMFSRWARRVETKGSETESPEPSKKTETRKTVKPPKLINYDTTTEAKPREEEFFGEYTYDRLNLVERYPATIGETKPDKPDKGAKEILSVVVLFLFVAGIMGFVLYLIITDS